MELHAVEAFFFVGHNGKRAGIGAGNGHEVGRDSGHFVAVAHPHVEQRFTGWAQRVFDAANQCAVGGNFHLRVTEFTLVGTLHMAAQLHCHGLHAVAYAQHRYTGGEHVFWRTRAVGFGGAFRAAGQDDAARIEFADLLFANVPGPQLAVNADFAHAAGDQLGVLRTKVQNQNAMLMDIFCHVRRIPATEKKENLKR
ncbi:hypothetical protein D3C80_819070 [compost metagenome]